MSSYSYNQNLGSMGMGGGISQFSRNQRDRLSLSAQIAPNPDELGSQVGAGGGALKDALDFVGDTKDVYKDFQDKKDKIMKAKSTLEGAAGAVRNAVSQGVGQAQNLASNITGSISQARQGIVNQVITGKNYNFNQKAPTFQRPAITPQSGSQEEGYMARSMNTVATDQKNYVGSLDDTTQNTIKSNITNDPVASMSHKAQGLSWDDRANILSKRSGIIDSAVDDARQASVSALQRGGGTLNSAGRVVGNVSGLNVNGMISNSGSAGNSALNTLHGATQTAQNAAGQAQGAIANGSNNIHGAIQTASNVGKDVEAGISDARDVVSAGLGVGETVLDALGPVGDLLGLGLGIFGGIEEHHEKEVAQRSAQQTQQQLQAPQQQSTVARVGGALDTSHQAPQQGTLHY